MSTSLVVNGVSYLYPDTGDQSWGTVASAWAAAVTSGMLQKSGGTFTLTADANFGANYGLLAKYFTSQSSNAAASGIIRLADTESVSWRNHANGADIALAKDTSDRLTWNGTVIASSAGVVPVTAGGTGLTAGTSGGILAFTGTTTIASSGLLTASQLIIGGGAGVAPSSLAAGSQHQVLVMGASNPGYGQVNLAQSAAVTGVLPNANTTAASANTASTIVARDVSGNFTAGTITAALTGTASGNLTYSANNHGVVLSSATNAVTVLAPDSSATKVLKSGGASADPSWLAYDNANTVSTLVFRDSSGNFSAGTITATLTGTASGNTTYTASNHGVVISGSANTMTVLAPDSSTTKVLKSGGASADPSWLAYSSTGTASNLVFLDSSANHQINNLIENYTTTATGAGTLTLTVSSSFNQYLTGSTTHTVVLPDATTLVLGHSFFIVNLSSGVVTVNKNGGTLVQSMAANSFMTVTVTNIGTSAGSWNPSYSVNNAGGGTVTSVACTVPSGLAVSGSPVTTSGTLAITASGQFAASQMPAFTGDVTSSAGAVAMTAAATQANITTLSNAAGVAVHGSNTNDSGGAGYVGEFIQNRQTTLTSIGGSSNQYVDLVSQSFTAGDWDISLVAMIQSQASASISFLGTGISTTTGNSSTGLQVGDNFVQQDFTTSLGNGLSVTQVIPPYRMSFSGATTVYAKCISTWATTAPKVQCRLSGRRVR